MRDRPVATEKIAVFTAVRRGWRAGAVKRRAIVRRRRGRSAVSLRHGQHRVTDQAEQAVAPRARREPQYTSAIKTYFRRLQAAVAEGDDERADAEHRRLVQLIDKAVKRGALHRNNGARKKSRAARLRKGAPE